MIFGLEKRHLLAQEVLESYANRHRFVDGFVGGISSFVPIPLFSNAASLALVTAQVRVVYRPLSRKIASIYLGKLENEALSFHEEAVMDAAQAAAKLAEFENKLNSLQNTLFNLEFLLEILHDVMGETLVGNAISAIPFIGMAASITMDMMIAATMTWRVGMMTALYCCNFEEWLGTRKDTYEISKRFVGPLSIKSKKRVDFSTIFEKNDSIIEKQIELLKCEFFDVLVREGKTNQQIVAEALKRQVPRYLIQHILHWE